VFDASSGALVQKAKGDTNKIHDVCFSAQPGSTQLATAGRKHLYFWDAKSGDKKKCLFGGNPMTSFSCVTYDADGICYTGGANSKIYVWEGRNCRDTYDFHKKGFICSIRWVDGFLYSGGKDGCVNKIDTTSMTVLKTFEFNSLVRAVDCFENRLIVGTRDGTIHSVCCDTDEREEIMHSHNEGEVWGLDHIPETAVITSGDDNQVIFWDFNNRRKFKSYEVSQRSVKAKRGGASTLSNYPDSKCSRAVACNADWLAVAGNDGAVCIRSVGGDYAEHKLLEDSSEWIEVMAFSPDNKYLAVGSHDNLVYVYDASDDFSLVGKCKGHSSYINCLDWSEDSTFIRTNCGAYELLFFTIPDCNQDPSGRSNTVATVWATESVHFSWSTEGIYPKGTDGTHVNGVAANADRTIISTGDDYGLVNLFRFPCRNGGIPRSYRGHSEHVVRVRFGENDQYLWSIGGYDQTLMQWKKC